ncbi:MAG: hypothetical protein ABL930_13695 [Pseudobdellovibrio sp.]
MKKFMMSALVVMFSLSAFSQDKDAAKDKKNEFMNQALEVLVKDVDKITMVGDVHADEKLKAILEEGLEPIVDALANMFGGDDDEYTGRVKDFTASCDEPTKLAAKCTIIITYKPIGETGIEFMVGLDKDGKPSSILGNRVSVSRGD